MASTNLPWKRANVLNSKPTIIRTISSIAIGRFMIFLALTISNLESGCKSPHFSTADYETNPVIG